MFTARSREQTRRCLQWAATLLVALLPLVLLWLGPRVMTQGLVPEPWDKLLHLLVFALLAVAVGLASRLRGAWALGAAFVVTVLVGAVDEWHQLGDPNRTADWSDFAADVSGAALGCLALAVLARWLGRQANHSAGQDLG